MTLSVIFLDDESRIRRPVEREVAVSAAKGLISSLQNLRKLNRRASLNCVRSISRLQISDNWTLQAALGGPAYREEWDFIRQLIDRSPIETGLEAWSDTVSTIDVRALPSGIQSVALSWAYMLSTATVSFACHQDWSRANVDAECHEIDGAGDITTSPAQIRNISSADHCANHAEWLRVLGLSDAPTAEAVWNERSERYPGLRFLPRVEEDLRSLASSGAPFAQALSALDDLCKDITERWEPTSPWPQMTRYATPESITRRSYCNSLDHVTNRLESFEWHIRFTGGIAGRIHFRIAPDERKAVVAYLGPKLFKNIP